MEYTADTILSSKTPYIKDPVTYVFNKIAVLRSEKINLEDEIDYILQWADDFLASKPGNEPFEKVFGVFPDEKIFSFLGAMPPKMQKAYRFGGFQEQTSGLPLMTTIPGTWQAGEDLMYIVGYLYKILKECRNQINHGSGSSVLSKIPKVLKVYCEALERLLNGLEQRKARPRVKVSSQQLMKDFETVYEKRKAMNNAQRRSAGKDNRRW